MTEDERLKSLLLRKKKIISSRDDLITFAEYLSPDANDPDNVGKSAYQAQRYHKVIAAALEQVEKGLMQRLIITVPPRHGKTHLASHTFIPWYMGRNPGNHVMVATYSSQFAWDFGRKIRDTLREPLYKHVFPNIEVKAGAAAVDRVELESGGRAFFLGRGSAATGRGANLLLIDDPLKSREEADSKVIREKLWSWYTQVMSTRLQSRDGRIVLIQTRWHESDLIGCLTDPANPFYNEKEAAKWHMVDLPALAEDNDILGRKPGDALWPEKFDKEFLESQKRTDPRGFMALYQGRPAPEDGIFFRADMLSEYHSPNARPKDEELRFYCASDHAVSTQQDRDRTCLLAFGVDKNDDIWIMPDSVWARIPTDRAVEQMCNLIRKYKPIFWFAEKGHISKSIGPFLRKRMVETKSYAAIDEITPIGDKQSRAQSVLGRMSSGKIYFPAFASWWPEARSEILKFPAASHDDFVDALSMMGLGLLKQMRPRSKQVQAPETSFGTGAWLHEMAKREKRKTEFSRARAGW
jgi:predicted phage terminase large subunit-like protein